MGRIIGIILGAIPAIWLAVTAAGGIVATLKTFVIIGLIGRPSWLAGSVEHDPAEVIAAAFDQAEARDPAGQRTWVILVDGASTSSA